MRSCVSTKFAGFVFPRVPTHLLVTAEDVANSLGACERLMDLHACATGVGKHKIYPLPLQSLHLRGSKQAQAA